MRFNLYQNTIVLNQSTDDPETYEYRTSFSSAFQVDQDFDAETYDYILELNGETFATTSIHHGIAEASLNFTFLDTHGEELLSDTLNIEINFLLGSTELEVWTEGGYEAVTYWNYFFDSMHFEIRVYRVGEKTPNSVNTTTMITISEQLATTAPAVS